MPYARQQRHDSGVSFTLPTPCGFATSLHTLSDPFSSDSDTSSTPHSFSSTSSSSSLASSPALPASPFSSVFPDLHLPDSIAKPTPTQLAAYASSIIRNEAYALLALAARMAPAAEPMVEDEPFRADLESHVQIGWERSESRTNLAFKEVVDSLGRLPAHGKVVITGVGKSGIVAKKMVATFNSLGIQSVFLHPLEALHGDLGVLCPCSPSSPCDALLLISHSGATAELMRLLPIVRPRVRTLIAVTRDPDSVLARGCANWLDAGTGADMGASARAGGEKAASDEADSALPAPTSSVVTAMAMGDALALCVSRLRVGWDKGGKERRLDFFRCHPGGQLGLELGREERGVLSPSS